jgi:hypothetical protein
MTTENDAIQVARAVASTFIGKPPTSLHTADHIDGVQKKNDALTNIRWLCKPGQRDNQIRSAACKTALIVVNNGIEKTVNEWVGHMNAVKKSEERKFTIGMINHYAQKKQHGFFYKEYSNLEGEKWEWIEGSKTKKGHWEISNMSRVKYVTNHAENVLWDERLGRSKGYPTLDINGKLGTASDNIKDSHDNGNRDGTKTARLALLGIKKKVRLAFWQST